MSIVQNDTSPIIAYLVLASDHVTPATGKTLTVTTSKNGAAFAAFGGTATELGNGFYKLTPVTADVGTLGDLAIRATAASCDDWTDVRRVVQAGATAADWSSTRAAKIDHLDADISTIAGYVDTEVAAIKAKTDNLPAAPAAVSDVPSAVAIADALLARNQQGGSNAAPTVSDALAGGLFDFTISAGTLTVKHGDGTTAFTRTLTRDQTMLLGAIIGAF